MHRSISPSILSLVVLGFASASLGAQGTPDRPTQGTLSAPAQPKPPVPSKAAPSAKPKAAPAKDGGDWKAKTAAAAHPDAKAQAAQARARAKATAAQKAKAADYARRVDLNSATKQDLKKVKGITDAIADQIIAGRPYLSKAHVVTHNIIPLSLYQTIKNQIKVEYKPVTPPAGTK